MENTTHIPTMPQTDGHIPTMPQTDGHIPTMPQGDGHIPTMPQGDGHIPTMPQGDGHIPTVPQTAAPLTRYNRSNKALLFEDVTFFGENGMCYVILHEQPVSLQSGESQIYRCRDAFGSDAYVARVLLSVRPDSPAAKRLGRERVIRFLSSKSRDENSHILPLLEHGSVRIGNYQYYVEVYPYCPEGDLGRKSGQFTYEELRDEIVPAINEALQEFHSANLVHRDLKPDNLYRYNGKVVIGDFGITCELGLDGFATDEEKTGTLGYFAPELMSKAAIVKSDYYSFGQTVWTLFTGEMMYQNILRTYSAFGVAKQREMVNQAMLVNKFFGFENLTGEAQFLEVLVRGLLLYDINSRFGYQEVKRWVAGDKSVAKEIPAFESDSIFKQPFKWKHYVCWDGFELHDCLAENWEEGKDLLYSGTLKDFYVLFDITVANQIDQIIKAYSRSGNEYDYDVGFAKLLHILCEGKMLCWRGNVFRSFGDIHAFLLEDNSQHTENSIVELFRSDLPLEWYDGYLSKQNQVNYRHSIELVHEFATWRPALGGALARYLFAQSQEDISYLGCADVDQLVARFLEKKSWMVLHGTQLVRNAKFLAFLIALGYEEDVRRVMNLAGGENAVDDIELAYTLLEELAQNEETKEALRRHYYDYGPQAHLTWWHQHLSMYEFHGEKANALRAELIMVSPQPAAALRFQRETLQVLRELNLRFKLLFANNVFLAELGFADEEAQITAKDPAAFWHYSFLDTEVPLGYVNHLELLGGERGE